MEDKTKSSFFDLKEGDVVLAHDEYSRDCDVHRVRVNSIEYDKENACEENPKGMTCYGDDLDEEEWGDDYVTVVTPGNFIEKIKVIELEDKRFVTVEDITEEESYKNPRITYLDYHENACWKLFVEYAVLVGAKFTKEDLNNPDWSITKEISEKIIELVEDTFGVPFPVSKEG